MSKVKLSLAGMSATEKIQFTRRIATAMELAVDQFPDPPANFDELGDLAYFLETAYNNAASARAAARTLTVVSDAAETQLDQIVTLVANYVQNVSSGDARMIALSGMAVRNAPSPVGTLTAPVGLVAVDGTGAGEVVLRWQALRGAMSYVVELTSDPQRRAWPTRKVSTRSGVRLGGLSGGTEYAFRVAALGAAGLSGWSEVVPKWVA